MSYNLTQSVLLFSYAAGRAENVWGTQAQVADFFRMALGPGGEWRGKYGAPPPLDQLDHRYRITGLLQSLGNELTGGDWSIVWGPCVYVAPGETCLANGMFVAYSKLTDAYVVAISPTNFISEFAKNEEDYNVYPDKMVDFPIRLDAEISAQWGPANHGKAQLSAGTAIGLRILCRMTDDATRQDLLTFLNGATRTAQTRLIFAGHSLGAALAPPLALQLRESLRSPWHKPNVLVFPTAGPTPGNHEFAKAWEKDFRRTPSGVTGNLFSEFNVRYWNYFDPAPYGWHDILGWYQYFSRPPEKMETKIGLYVGSNAAELNAVYEDRHMRGRECNMTQLIAETQFRGSWPVKYLSNGTPATYTLPSSFHTYNELLFGQGMVHMWQYYQAAGIDPWQVPQPAYRLD